MFHGQLKRLCILLFLGEVFCKCQLNPVTWWCSISSLILCLGVLSIAERRILDSPTITVDLSPPFQSSTCCFLYFVAHCLVPPPYLRLLCLLAGLILSSLHNMPIAGKFLHSKVYFIDIIIATSAFLQLMFAWYVFLYLFTFNLPIQLYLSEFLVDGIQLGHIFYSILPIFVFQLMDFDHLHFWIIFIYLLKYSWDTMFF